MFLHQPVDGDDLIASQFTSIAKLLRVKLSSMVRARMAVEQCVGEKIHRPLIVGHSIPGSAPLQSRECASVMAPGRVDR
jgi:hypothetical protein